MMNEIKERLREKVEAMVAEAIEDWVDNIDLTDFVSYCDVEDKLNNKLSEAFSLDEIIDEMFDDVIEDTIDDYFN